MSIYPFGTLIDRKNTDSVKWNACRNQDVIPMWVADMDFASPPAVIDALRHRVDHGVFGYTLPPEELVEVLVARFRDFYGWPIEPDWLIWLPGVVSGIVAACQAFTAPGDEVVMFIPAYPPFLSLPASCGRKGVKIALVCEEGRYRLDPEAFVRALTPRTKLLLLCQPHNPVGRVFTESELAPILEQCRARGIVVCSDEIHCDLTLQRQPHRPVASFCAAPEASITLMSPGKTFNIAGLNLGFAVVPDPGLRQRMNCARQYAMPQPNLLAYAATLAAYRDGEPWRQALLDILRRNAAQVQRTINEDIPNLTTGLVEATYLAWIDARALSHTNPCKLFNDFGLALSDGADFGAPGFVRLNFGCPKSLLEEGLNRLARASISRSG